MTKATPAVTWKHDPDDHDHPAADGHLRVCASYHVDENTEIPCRIVAWDD